MTMQIGMDLVLVLVNLFFGKMEHLVLEQQG
eukprot:CAMPEP_0117053454 /NCGR_PEP_ID=MMETSP0472-20121206/36972_1 /TAXON_ID=693140 ORGANISM="Tiarina fusus, Strain LIS" /NCGR_SAMPLE_ID=MMETSP0472 /ASSEMBLY_ACC=CAM_ASM_000603 /LENGTH=30 /DNA_ID= /DNA_START= /DNA_END= /DNA_ORIENTATION=